MFSHVLNTYACWISSAGSLTSYPGGLGCTTCSRHRPYFGDMHETNLTKQALLLGSVNVTGAVKVL
jgi:hypothetical protein